MGGFHVAVWPARLRLRGVFGAVLLLVALIVVPTGAVTTSAARSPTAGPGSGSSSCADTIWHLLPQEANVSQISRFYGKADERIKKVFSDVSTSGAYTIFLSVDAVFSYTGSPNDPVMVIQRMSDSAFTSWLLYNILPTAMPVDQIGLARRLPTLLTRATGLDVYDLRSSLPANFAFGGRVELYDLLGDDVQILASFPICNSWVHTINGVLWPAPKNNVTAMPEPVPGGSLNGKFVPPTFPNPTSIGSLTAQLPNPIALPNPPAGLPNPAAGQQVVQKVVSAVTAGISGVVNSISSNGEDQPPLPGPNGLPALPGQAGFAATPPPGLLNSTIYGATGSSKTPAVVGGVVGGLVIVLVVLGFVMGIALKHRRSNIVMMRQADEVSKDGDGFHSPHGFFSSDSDFSAAEVTYGKEGIAKGGLKDSASSVDGTYVESLDPEACLDPEDFCRNGHNGRSTSEESAGVRLDWEVPPEDITICKDAYGRDIKLGHGGFGSVYRAMLQGSTPVAVKFVSGHSPKEQSRFKNEVDILKGLRHTNIVQFLGASFAGGQIMLVTEFLPRGDLWRALSNDTKHVFSWYNRGRQVALDIVRGLQYMHSKKVMHLDLKSANILLARDGGAKIADVGLAKILTRDNTHVSMEGTFDWAAPEVLAGAQVSEKCDIFSLGVVLWEIVTGERPHFRQLRPLQVPDECPEDVDAIIRACRRVDPAERPTAKEVYDVLARSPSRQNSTAERNVSALSIASRTVTSSTSSAAAERTQRTSTSNFEVFVDSSSATANVTAPQPDIREHRSSESGYVLT
eukprot:jgi/Botrbrau1/2613/Bobra.145_1s0034.2